MSNQAIVYLLNKNSKDILNFRKSIQSLLYNYYEWFPCDIICFYEDDFPIEELDNLKQKLINIKVSFVKIDFSIPNHYTSDQLASIPEYFPHPDFPQAQGFSIGYRHMCRFFSGAIFTHPTLTDYKYIWRLDTDSFIVSPIQYNVFDKLQENNSIYGYINIQHDHPGTIKNLWEISQQYFTTLNKNHIFQQPDITHHKNRVFYTNFEIFDMEWFRSKNYMDYFNFIDNTAGIYQYRWGDHSIRYIALNSLATPDQLYFYDDIHYFHQKEYLNNRINASNVN